METEPISNCQPSDFLQIIDDLEDFWGSTRTLSYHHPMFVHEFGDTAFVIKRNNLVIAYLFGFLSQKEKRGYIHLIGVRQSFQQKGMGRQLYDHFIKYLKQREIHELKAITTPTNEKSIKFHQKMGMTMVGEKNKDGIHVIKNYSGRGQDRVVFTMKF
jgi:ribosomal protein S18 acetylase RimI-like enzyme